MKPILAALTLLFAGGAIQATTTESTESPEFAQMQLINADRSLHGLPPLVWSDCLAGVAGDNAIRMANKDREWHDGGVFQDVNRCQLDASGENIGQFPLGFASGRVNAAFMSDPVHRGNILGTQFQYVGIAYRYRDDKGWAFVAIEFGGKNPVQAAPGDTTGAASEAEGEVDSEQTETSSDD